MSIRVISTSKPSRAVETITALVQVEGTATAEEVTDAALSALGETKGSLFGWGIWDHLAGEPITDRRVVFYAHRD